MGVSETLLFGRKAAKKEYGGCKVEAYRGNLNKTGYDLHLASGGRNVGILSLVHDTVHAVSVEIVEYTTL